jgi:hypothetical protein
VEGWGEKKFDYDGNDWNFLGNLQKENITEQP